MDKTKKEIIERAYELGEKYGEGSSICLTLDVHLAAHDFEMLIWAE